MSESNVKIYASKDWVLEQLDIPNDNILNGEANGSLRTSMSSVENDEYKLGTGAFTEGTSTKAIGDYSHAEGDSSIAMGHVSHAEGSGKTVGYASHAEGFSVAYGEYSHSEGSGDGNYALVISGEANATTYTSTTLYEDCLDLVIFYNDKAARITSVNVPNLTFTTNVTLSDTALSGVTATVPRSSIATGENAHAEGKRTKAKGAYSHAEGNGTIASGANSHAEGNGTMAFGDDSHAENNYSFAIGNYSHAESNTVAYGISSHSEGTGYRSVGYLLTGEANSTTYVYAPPYEHYPYYPEINQVLVYDNNISKIIDIDSANSILIVDKTLSSEELVNAQSSLIGTVAIGNGGHSENFATKAIGQSSHSEGSQTNAFGNNSHAEGIVTYAIGEGSHTEGQATAAYGDFSHTEGYGTNWGANYISGEANSTTYTHPRIDSIKLGTVVNCQGRHAKIIAKDDINGTFSVNVTLSPNYALNNAPAKFYSHSATGAGSHAEGHDTVAASDYQHVQGKYNIPDIENVYAHIVGNGSDSVCSNAHTVDWNGNGWFKGEVYVGGTRQSEGTMLAHQPLILEFTVPSSSLESGTEYNLGYKRINSTDIIEIKPDYTKDTSAEYREAIRNANFGARLGEIYDYENGKVDYNFFIIPDGEIDTSIENYYFYVINHGKGGAW